MTTHDSSATSSSNSSSCVSDETNVVHCMEILRLLLGECEGEQLQRVAAILYVRCACVCVCACACMCGVRREKRRERPSVLCECVGV